MVLDKEISYFNRQKSKWVAKKHKGEWAVIVGSELVGFFKSYDDAYRAGRQKRPGGEDFLIKRVVLQDPLETVQRVFLRPSGQPS